MYIHALKRDERDGRLVQGELQLERMTMEGAHIFAAPQQGKQQQGES